MTPADYGAEAEGDGDGSEESSSESSDGEPLSLDAYDPDPGQVQKLRPTGNEGKKQVCWLGMVFIRDGSWILLLQYISRLGSETALLRTLLYSKPDFERRTGNIGVSFPLSEHLKQFFRAKVPDTGINPKKTLQKQSSSKTEMSEPFEAKF